MCAGWRASSGVASEYIAQETPVTALISQFFQASVGNLVLSFAVRSRRGSRRIFFADIVVNSRPLCHNPETNHWISVWRPAASQRSRKIVAIGGQCIQG